jgi:hypothetical protein
MEEINSDINIEESDTIELEKVLLNRSWSFWENYDSKVKNQKAYSESVKEIYNFDNIIAFWQFWNKYPGNNSKEIFYNGECMKYFFEEKYRITAMNIFEKGIKPEWEHEKNKKGKILSLEYIINEGLDSFFSRADKLWIKLITLLIGETIPYSNNINGIRFVDKTKSGYHISVMFKFEIWVNKLMKEEELEEIKKLLSKEFGCSGTIKPIV